MLVVPRPWEGGLRRGEIFWLRPTTASAQCLRLCECFFIIVYFPVELDYVMDLLGCSQLNNLSSIRKTYFINSTLTVNLY